MHILERAKGDSGEVVPITESESNIRDEVNRRTCRAGLTNRDGGPPATGNIRSRMFTNKGKENYEKIFGHE